MNKNSKRRFSATHKALGRVKRGVGSADDEILAGYARHQSRKSKHPKVARQANAFQPIS